MQYTYAIYSFKMNKECNFSEYEIVPQCIACINNTQYECVSNIISFQCIYWMPIMQIWFVYRSQYWNDNASSKNEFLFIESIWMQGTLLAN